MKLKVGDKIQVLRKEKREDKERDGEIVAIYKNFIVVKFKKYKESFTKAEIIAPVDTVLKVRKDKQWLDVKGDMF